LYSLLYHKRAKKCQNIIKDFRDILKLENTKQEEVGRKERSLGMTVR